MIPRWTQRELASLEEVKEPVDLGDHDGPLRLIAFSDYRVQDLAILLAFLKGLAARPHLILYAGDDLGRFHVPPAKNFLQEIAATSTYGLCAVAGNDSSISADGESSSQAIVRLADEVAHERSMINGTRVYNVHVRPVLVGPYAFIGNEGAPLNREAGAIGTILYPETSIARHLRASAKVAASRRLIVVSHAPPRLVLDLAERFGKRNIGSAALKKFVLSNRSTVLVVAGHVHRCGGQSRRLGRTVILNAASHDDPGAVGKVALVELQGVIRSIRWENLYELDSIPGIGGPRKEALRSMGISTPSELSRTSPDTIRRPLRVAHVDANMFVFRARALCEGKPILIAEPSFPTGPRAFLDIETDHYGKLIWLIGLYVAPRNKYYHFFAKNPGAERSTLQRFLEFLNGLPDLKVLSYSGTHFEKRLLKDRLAFHGLPEGSADSILDLYSDVQRCVALPVCENRLKPIAEFFGYKYLYPELDGFQVPIEYSKFVRTGRASIRKRLVGYNRDDVLSLRYVVDQIEGLAVRHDPAF